ncbi:MAG: peptidylprolyl isomerase [Nitrospinae bacterium]|nr:peptidylprolyl isomerase [Nitrospinota bacterium]
MIIKKNLIMFAFVFAVALQFAGGPKAALGAEEKGKQAPAAKHAETAKPAAAASQEKFDAEKLPKVVAQVNKISIEKGPFARIMNNALSNAAGHEIVGDQLKKLEKNVLDQLIATEVLYEAATNAGIKPADKDLEKQVGEIKSRFKTEEEFNKALTSQKMTLDELKTEVRRNMAIHNYVESKLVVGVKVSEADAQKYYNDNKDKFKTPEMVRARHIILMLDPKADEKTKAETKKKMEEIQGKLKGGAKFEELAEKYSQDGSKSKGGDLGFFPKGAMVKEFEDAVFSMKPGEVSGIVTTQFGLHLIKFEEKKPAGTTQFSEVKEMVVKGLEGDAKRDKVTKAIDELKKKATIKVNINI